MPVEVIQEVEVPVVEVVDRVVERQVMVEQIQTVDKPVVQYVEKVPLRREGFCLCHAY